MSDEALLISTRQRATWTTDEKRRLSRVAKDFNMHGDKLLMRCGNTTCPDPAIRLFMDASAPTGAVLRCACTDRLFTPSC